MLEADYCLSPADTEAMREQAILEEIEELKQMDNVDWEYWNERPPYNPGRASVSDA